MRYAERMLQTIHHCDSLSRLRLTVSPSYFFYTDTTICANEVVTYRGKRFTRKDTTYTEYLKTSAGCDSIYQFRLHVKPAYMFHRFVSTCDNEVLYHESQNGRELIWQPSHSLIDTLTDAIYSTIENCDSTYRYHITIYPSFFSLDSVTLCSGELYPMHEHLHVGLDTVYDQMVSGCIPERDSLFVDSLSTIHGCDSVYWLQAHIVPQYHHVDYDTICDNEMTQWRERTYSGIMYEHLSGQGLAAGKYVYFDSLKTQRGCDSVYEFRLLVNPTYQYPLEASLCQDELPFVQGEIIIYGDQLQSHDIANHVWHCDSTIHFYTVNGCDSIIRLALIVKDTTCEIIYDTICQTDTFFLYDKTYTRAGFYKDTTLNAWGCHNFVYLYLTVIPPTKYWLQIPDICADEEYIEIGYMYEGYPIKDFSVYFDSLGHAQGFQDIYHEPITDPENHIFQIPIPHGDNLPHPQPTYFDSQVGVNDSVYEDKQSYPEPNDYHATFVLGNGICSDRLQMQDTTLQILYPHWIHEQHWNDGIVLFNAQYNGGYTFSHYQWFVNDVPIVGQTREFLYWPDSLQLNQRGVQPCVNEYKVQLTREKDGYTTFTCPICPVQIYDHIVPKLDYFSIVPTLVVKDNPVVWILTTEPLTYRVIGGGGLFTSQPQHVEPDANNYAGTINLSNISGPVAIIELVTDSGHRRTFEVLIVP